MSVALSGNIIEIGYFKEQQNMPSSFWDAAIIPIFFVYGLAFYSLGLTLWVESGRVSELGFARSMRLMAAFGLLHGVHEWLDMLECGLALFYCTSLPVALIWFRVALLATSFVALLAFGEHLLARERHDRLPSWKLTIGLVILFATASIAVQVINRLDDVSWSSAIGVLARYIIGIPGSLVAGWALWRQRPIFRQRGMGTFSRELTWTTLALTLYGGIGQMFVNPSVIFPSMYWNSTLFLQVFGFPVQLFRTMMAIIIAIAMIRVLRALEVENQQRLEAIERSKFEAERQSHRELARMNADLQAANAETERLFKEVQRRDAVRGELLQRITAAQEAERKRIARELHDETGQTLTGLALGLRGASAMHNPAAIAGRLAELETMATAALDGLRRMINDLRPPQLDDIGLAAALRFMVERMNNHHGLQVHFEVNGTPRPLPAEVETLMFRIAQEGLNNVLKHAHASQVWISSTTSVGKEGRKRHNPAIP
jgi:signal transduction histidine kinase